MVENKYETEIVHKYIELEKKDFFIDKRKQFQLDDDEFKNKYGISFFEKFDIEKIKLLNGKELLNYLFEDKNDDTNTIGLTRAMEFCMKSYGSFTGTDWAKSPVSYSSNKKYPNEGRTWRDYTGEMLSEENAIKIAGSTKDKLVKLNNYLAVNEFENFFKECPNDRYYRFYHKYFYMFFPNMLTSYHSKDFAKNHKVKLGINITEKLALEKYLWDLKNKYSLERAYIDDLRLTIEELWGIGISAQDYDKIENKEELTMNKQTIDEPNFIQPLNQILYGPPGTGKTYNTIHNALQIMNPEKLFEEWFYKNSNAEEKEKAYKTYNKELKELSEEFKTDVFQEYNVSKFLKLKDTILHSNYFNNEKEHADTSPGTSYCETALNWYEKFLKYFSKTDKIRFVTFHQSYSYEEFVEGIKPAPDKNGMKFELKNGIFKEMCIKANSNPSHKYVLVIDEINRGNISKIFGELITLIEDNKRIIPNGKTKEVNGRKELDIDCSSKGDESLIVTLPYSQEEFGVPNNLYIIGTMNTADKSLALLDVALRRRFEFVAMYPKSDLVTKYNKGNEENRKTVLDVINENILASPAMCNKNNKYDYLIGHAYFMSDDSIKTILKKKIIPLLMEYFNGDTKKVEGIINGTGYEAKFHTDNKPFYEWTVKKIETAEIKEGQDSQENQEQAPDDETN